jgi:hypothetical protein
LISTVGGGLCLYDVATARTLQKICSVAAVADRDDPFVSGPPGSGSPISQRYGSGSFYHQAQKYQENLESYCFVTSLRLIIFSHEHGSADPDPYKNHGSATLKILIHFSERGFVTYDS